MKEINDQVKHLWMMGLTGSQIGKELSLTRNAVLGKVHRMREAGTIGVRECDMRLRSIKAEVKRLEDERQASLPDILRDVPTLEKEKSPKEPKKKTEIVCQPTFLFEDLPPHDPKWKPLKFDQLTPRSCRYVLNDGPASQFLFCGKQKKGRSYCEDHEKLCYYYLPKKVRA
jgi:hypothetical protein